MDTISGAIPTILCAAGYEVMKEEENNYAPYDLVVKGRQSMTL
jgi:hypothetical protein